MRTKAEPPLKALILKTNYKNKKTLQNNHARSLHSLETLRTQRDPL